MKKIINERKEIEDYWNDPSSVSLIDKNLRKLETDFVLKYLNGDEYFADLGCGGGESTLKYAKKVKKCLALEQSRTLRKKAEVLFKDEHINNIKLVEGNILKPLDYVNIFDTVLTQRVIINFMTWEEQKKVLINIYQSIKPGGLYLCIENTIEGFDEMNILRQKVGLNKIMLHDWHNYFLHHKRFIDFMDKYFLFEKIHTFNLYYLLTRVFLNMFAKFEGYGSNATKDDIFDVADKSARILQENYCENINFNLLNGKSFGPIQGFVFRKK